MLRSITHSAAIMTFLLGVAVIPIDSSQELLGTPRFTIELEVTVEPLEFQYAENVCTSDEELMLVPITTDEPASFTCVSVVEREIQVAPIPGGWLCWYYGVCVSGY